MTQLQLATGRIVLPYTISGENHKVEAFVRGLTLVGSNWMHNSRTLDETDLAWVDSATRFGLAVENMFPTGSSVGTALLQQLTDGVWITVDSSDISLTSPSGTLYAATQVTLTLVDKYLNKVRVVMLDSNEQAPQKILAPTLGDAHFDAFIAPFIAGGGNTNDPFNWMVSKGNQYLKTSPFIRASVALNRKLRRARGV